MSTSILPDGSVVVRLSSHTVHLDVRSRAIHLRAALEKDELGGSILESFPQTAVHRVRVVREGERRHHLLLDLRSGRALSLGESPTHDMAMLTARVVADLARCKIDVSEGARVVPPPTLVFSGSVTIEARAEPAAAVRAAMDPFEAPTGRIRLRGAGAPAPEAPSAPSRTEPPAPPAGAPKDLRRSAKDPTLAKRTSPGKVSPAPAARTRRPAAEGPTAARAPARGPEREAGIDLLEPPTLLDLSMSTLHDLELPARIALQSSRAATEVTGAASPGSAPVAPAAPVAQAEPAEPERAPQPREASLVPRARVVADDGEDPEDAHFRAHGARPRSRRPRTAT